MSGTSTHKIPFAIPMPNNMGMVRYILAFAVLVNHFNLLVGGDFYFPLSSHEAVSGFFALSGFLIYGSYIRSKSASAFLKKRALRLLPPYAAVVIACAVGMAAVSSLSAADYFVSPDFWKYLGANLSFLNFLHPTLPGVFDNMTIRAVDGSLWTMKIEWIMYLSVIPAVWIVSRMRRHRTVVFAVIYLLSAVYGIACMRMYDCTGNENWLILERQVFGQISYFYVGVFIYCHFDWFMKHRYTVPACAVVLYAVRLFSPYWTRFFIDPVSLGIIVIWLSMAGNWGHFENRLPNLSYSIYIVHWPIFQLAAMRGLADTLGLSLTFVISTAVTVTVSYLIYMTVEKPVKRYFSRRGKTVAGRRL